MWAKRVAGQSVLIQLTARMLVKNAVDSGQLILGVLSAQALRTCGRYSQSPVIVVEGWLDDVFDKFGVSACLTLLPASALAPAAPVLPTPSL